MLRAVSVGVDYRFRALVMEKASILLDARVLGMTRIAGGFANSIAID